MTEKTQVVFVFALLMVLFFGLASPFYAQETDAKEDPTELPAKCVGCPHAKACFEDANTSSLPLRNYLWPVPFLLIAGGLALFKKLKFKQFLLFSLGIVLVYSVQQIYRATEMPSPEKRHKTQEFVEWNDSSLTDGNEFPEWEDSSVSSESSAIEVEDSTVTMDAEQTSLDDEFEAFSENEFETFESSSTDKLNYNSDSKDEDAREKEQQGTLLKYVIPILLITLLTGILSRFRFTRRFRLIFLLGGLIYMGFYNGGCPCMISSFQDFVMWMFGADVFWGTMLWFVGLMVITYFFGRVWCSWFCHLGALQEFIYKAKIIRPLKSKKAQSFFIWMRIATMMVLLVQIALTQTNIFIHYDPFKVAFNLFSTNATGYFLLVLLLISSLLINRPFCRGFCPVGLAMGWVLRIPGASVLKPDDTCIGCKGCSNTCEAGAIVRVNNLSILNNAECIRCGDCMDNCTKSSLQVKVGNGEIEYACIGQK